MQSKFWLDPKFWTGVLDALIVCALYFAGKYGAPGLLDDMKLVIGAIQPIFLMIIVGMFQEQQTAIALGQFPKFMAK